MKTQKELAFTFYSFQMSLFMDIYSSEYNTECFGNFVYASLFSIIKKRFEKIILLVDLRKFQRYGENLLHSLRS